MIKKLFLVLLVLMVTVAWIGTSYAQPAAPSQVLRITTILVLPEKRAQVSTMINEIDKLYTATKEIQWSKIGYDAFTGELVTVTLWKSQSDVAKFMESEARKAVVEKLRPFMQGDPSIKTYPVYESTK